MENYLNEVSMTEEELRRIMASLGSGFLDVEQLDNDKKAEVFRCMQSMQIGGYNFDGFTEEDKINFKGYLKRSFYDGALDALLCKFGNEAAKQAKLDGEHIAELTDDEVERTFPPAPSCEEEVLENECLALIKRLIDTILPDNQASRLKRYYFEGMTEQAIADEDGVSRQSVSQSIIHSIKRLRKALRRQGYYVPNI